MHCIIMIFISLDVLDPRDDLRMVDGVKKVIQDFPKVTGKWTGLQGANQIIRYCTYN